MKIVTHTIHPDEECHGLFEGRKPRPMADGTMQVRWVQQVFVVRDDNIACYETDMGAPEKWPNAVQIWYPSFGENTVAQLQFLAEMDRRDGQPVAKAHREEVAANSTLIQDVIRQIEARKDIAANRSHIGPAIAIQRNDNPRRAIIDKHKERNARRSTA